MKGCTVLRCKFPLNFRLALPTDRKLHWFHIWDSVTFTMAVVVYRCLNGRTQDYLAAGADWAAHATLFIGLWGRLSAWHFPGWPVGPASRRAATSNVVVGQMTDPINIGQGRGEKRQLKMREWKM